MRKVFIVVMMAVAIAAGGLTGCKTKSGSREFIPGKGWRQN